MSNDEHAATTGSTASSELTGGIDQRSRREIECLLLAKQEDVVILCDFDTKILYISESARHVLGYDPDTEIGKDFANYIFPEDLERIAVDWQRFTEGHNDHPPQFRAQHIDGHWIWFEARTAMVKEPGYEETIVVNLREIEHHKRLRAHSEIAQRAARLGTWRWDLNNEHPQWSDGLYEILGYTPTSDPLNMDWVLTLCHPDDRTHLFDLISEALKDMRSFHSIARVMGANGQYLTMAIHAYVETNNTDEPQAILGVSQDITTTVDAQSALRKSEQEYRLLTEQSTDLICRYDARGKCTFASSAILTIMGQNPEDVINTNALQHVLDVDQKLVVEAYEKAMIDEVPPRVTYRVHHKNGSLVWLEASVRPLYDDHGKLTETIVIARDVSNQQKHQQELQDARVKAEAASHTKSRFLANMSHELRTPLNAIIGFSDIMSEEMFGPLGAAQYTDYSKLIRESGQFLLALINDILDMSKIEAGKYDLFLEDLDLKDSIDSCLRVVEQRAKAENVEISYSLDENLPYIHADERTVKQIFLNLLSNAVKFTPEGGSIHVSAKQDGARVHVYVEDTGCGIPEADLPRLAQPFEQVTSEATHAQTGTGLGLALVKSFVTLHGGTMDINSTEGKGTCVSFTLPMSTGNISQTTQAI